MLLLELSSAAEFEQEKVSSMPPMYYENTLATVSKIGYTDNVEAALLPGGNKIKLQELAKDELLASLNEPFNKQVAEAEVAVDERDVVDCAVVEEKDEMLQLTELKRVKVIEEIFETEKKYLECLETVDKVFRAPMLHEGIAQEKDIHALFPNCLSTIQECHSWFMGELENRMKCEEWQGSIGDILGKMAGPLKDNLLNVYTDYVNAFPKSVSTFSKCTRTSQKFRKFIENCYDKSDNLDLPSYLITPVQRLPRYVLLLRQLSKYTRDDHPDNESIKTALLQMEELIRSLNGSITSSMHIYTSRESENRKSVKRQSSKRRKKQRPVTLNLSNLKDVKTINDKLEKPNCNNNTANQNGISRVSQDKEESSNRQGDQKLIESPEKKSQSNKLDAPSPTHLQLTPSPIQLRKNKSEHRKSLRRSLGAALSSFWSPKDEKELKGINEKGDDKLTPTTTDNTPPSSSSSNSRRKLGVIHHFPPSSATNSPVEATSPSKSTSEDGVKRQRFSNSFRERTREFRIQMRRRSGTWSTAPIEDKEADSTMTSYASSSSTDSRSLFPAAANDKRPASATSSPVSSSRGSRIGSSLMSMFNKRKSKQQSDEDIHRRRSDSDRDFQLLKTPDDKVLSVSMSYPNFPNQRKDSKALSISSSICEESYDTNSEHCTNLSTIKDETTTPGEKETSEHDLTNGHVENGTFSDGTEGTTTSKSVTKKPKKGKIMKTLRHMMGKGKN